MIPVSAPTRVAAVLRAAPDGPARILHRGPDAVYVAVSGTCVGVVARRATAVPCALRCDLERLDDLGPAAAAATGGGTLHLDGVPLRIGRFVDVRVPRLTVPDDVEQTPLSEAEVVALVGAGDGLTPYGDDVLCGWLALHRAAGLATPEVDRLVFELAERTTLLSATLLECAMHGEVVPEFGAWVAALGTDDEPAAQAALVAIGHSSGRGLLEGGRRAVAGLGLEVAA